MTTLREFLFDDLLKFNRIVFDPLTAVYSLSFFITRILECPRLQEVIVAPNEQLVGFMLGTQTAQDDEIGDAKDTVSNECNGHVCAISIDHEYRRLGLATMLLKRFNDRLNQQRYMYVGLFVRSKNQCAIRLYRSLGYVEYRWMPSFYEDDHGYEMRLPLLQDVERKCLQNKMHMFEDMDLYVIGQQLYQMLLKYLKRFTNVIFSFRNMTCLREMQLEDLFKFNALVFDPLTEVYRLGFFMRHIAIWPDLAIASVTPADQLVGFIFGKCQDGSKDNTQLHGHVCALTVLSDYRRLGIASSLMNQFAQALDLCKAWYVDLYLRCSNVAAYQLYCSLGFTLRRILLEYYPGMPEEDAYDMRKPLAIDSEGQSITMASRESVRLPSDDESDDDY